MIIRVTNPNYSSEEINALCREVVPGYLRIPFSLSIRFLSATSIGEFCNSKTAIDQKKKEISTAGHNFERRFHWMNKPPNLAYFPLIFAAAIPFLSSIIIYSLLYKKLDLRLLKHSLNCQLPHSIEDLDKIEMEFFRTIDLFPFKQSVVRRAKQIFQEKRQLILISKKNETFNLNIIQNYKQVVLNNTTVNNHFHPRHIVINQFKSPFPIKPIRLFDYKGTSKEVDKLSELLARYKFIDQDNCLFFQSFFVVLKGGEIPQELRPVLWYGGANELIFLFITLSHYKIISRNEIDRLASKVESNFYDTKGNYIKNLGIPKNRFDELKLTPEQYAIKYPDSRFMDLFLITKSVYGQYVKAKL